MVRWLLQRDVYSEITTGRLKGTVLVTISLVADLEIETGVVRDRG